MLFSDSVGTHQQNGPTHKSSGNARPQSSQLAEPLWTHLWPKRVEMVRANCLHLKKKKKAQAGMIRRTVPYYNPRTRGISHHH